MLSAEQRQRLSVLHANKPSNGFYIATEQNGDDVKGLWTDQSVHSLINASDRVLRKVQAIVDQVVFQEQFQILVNKPEMTMAERMSILRVLKRFDFTDELVKALRSEVDVMVKVLVNLSNNVFVAASTRLVQGLTDQFNEDDDLAGIVIQFDHDQAITARELVVFGLPAKQYFELLFSGVFTEQWFLTTVVNTIESSTSYNVYKSRVSVLVSNRMKLLTNNIRDVVQEIIQQATIKATQQFANISIKVQE